MAGQSNPYTPITFSAVLPLKNGIFAVNMPTPPVGSLIKPSKSMLLLQIWNANFSVTPINSHMYMTKPKQVQKTLPENTGKTFSVIMPSFTCRGWAYLRKLLYFLWWTSEDSSTDMRFVKNFTWRDFWANKFTHYRCVNYGYFYSEWNSVNA